MPRFDSISTIEKALGGISCLACFTVMLTYFVFPDIRNLRYVELVFYVSISCMVASIGVSLGAVENGSAGCYFQGITTNIFYVSSTFWTTVISYQVWLVVYHNVVLKDLVYFHIICWVLPIVLALLPFTTNDYGNVDDETAWCSVSDRQGSPAWAQLFWNVLSFYGWVWFAILVNTLLLLSARMRIRRDLAFMDKAVSKVTYEATLAKIKKLVWYPRILTFCWVSVTVFDIYQEIHKIHAHNDLFNYFSRLVTVLAIVQGILLSVAFFVMNPIIRNKWRMLFRQMYNKHIRSKQNGSNSNSDNNEDSSRYSTAPRSFCSSISVEEEFDYIAPRPSATSRLFSKESINSEFSDSGIMFSAPNTNRHSTASNPMGVSPKGSPISKSRKGGNGAEIVSAALNKERESIEV